MIFLPPASIAAKTYPLGLIHAARPALRRTHQPALTPLLTAPDT